MSTHTADNLASGVSVTRRGLGICVTPLETRREVILHVARRAEDLGYDGFFLAEGWSQDAAVLLTEIATKTERITIGTGVLSVWGRTAGTLAMLATSLDQVSHGRFVLGLGASSPQLVEGLHDQSFTAQVRRLLDGDRVRPTATHDQRPLRLGVAPRTGLPIYLAALGNKSIQLAGELADGWTPFLVPRSWLPHGIELLQQAGARSGRTTRPLVCPAVPTAVAAEHATAREIASWWITFYLTSMGSLYRRSLSERGYHRQVEAVLAVNPTHDTTDVPAAAQDLLDELTVRGTPDTARDQLQHWYTAGAEMPILTLPPHRTIAELDYMLETMRPHP
ncbi:LLM class flavin-dependent oxidoreductase [Rhodococcus sp. LB1]|uniref:LLM class flavin-dependent oxidoreductase n=1 Tax=Rhodococcus sp. LB1 TaxID=1807499 RepID=UPI00077A330E|nr:LLM class flavin-dependent oxidoreductase [Rhodococcus sp. LB1]KXX57162.1 monooxygenase [Rhodococcus sp. LB1]